MLTTFSESQDSRLPIYPSLQYEKGVRLEESHHFRIEIFRIRSGQ